MDEVFNVNPKEQSSAQDRTAILQHCVNIEEDPETVVAEDIRVLLQEIHVHVEFSTNCRFSNECSWPLSMIKIWGGLINIHES